MCPATRFTALRVVYGVAWKPKNRRAAIILRTVMGIVKEIKTLPLVLLHP